MFTGAPPIMAALLEREDYEAQAPEWQLPAVQIGEKVFALDNFLLKAL